MGPFVSRAHGPSSLIKPNAAFHLFLEVGALSLGEP